MISAELRYQVVKDDSLIGEEQDSLPAAVLLAACYDGHAAKFVRDKHNFMCFYASRQKMSQQEYIPVPCDAFRPWSPSGDDQEAQEQVAEMIAESGLLHSKIEGLQIITLTYSQGELVNICEKASPAIKSELSKAKRT
jgi:hypothetical protein